MIQKISSVTHVLKWDNKHCKLYVSIAVSSTVISNFHSVLDYLSGLFKSLVATATDL